MRRVGRSVRWLWGLLLVLSVGCVAPTLPSLPETSTPRPAATLSDAPASASPITASETATSTPIPTVVQPRPTYTSTPVPRPQPTSTPVPDPLLAPEDVLVVPQPLYEGDRISVDVDPSLPPGFDWSEDEVPEITLTLPDGETVVSDVSVMGLADTPQARFYWVDELPITRGDADVATGSAPDLVTPTVSLTLTLRLPSGVPDEDLDNNILTLTLPLRRPDRLLPPEPDTSWEVTETIGFAMHYLTGSAAERDLSTVLAASDRAYLDVTSEFERSGNEVAPDALVDIYLLDRVIGQGGYASSDWVAISYTDRSYAPVSLDLVLRHELTHRLDDAIGCDDAPAMLREGLAVTLAGGHYRPESSRTKAAALLSTTHYVPLSELVDGFYTHQHEVGYLEAAAVVSYLLDRWGWSQLPELCAAAGDGGGSDVERWAALLDALGFETSADFERAWQRWLQASETDANAPRLIELELQLMDLMRAYQAGYDQGAHFLDGILFSPQEAEERGIVADFVRRPRDAEAITFELLLALGQEALANEDKVMLEMLLSDLRVALQEGIDQAPYASEIKALTVRMLSQAWEPYRLVVESDDCLLFYVINRKDWPQQSTLTARRDGEVWDLKGGIWRD